MCGIICVILLKSHKIVTKITTEQIQLLENRGPDAADYEIIHPSLHMGGFVLWQQGLTLSKQPLKGGNTYLLFNGDIFNANKSKPLSDSQWLLEKLDSLEDNEDIYSFFLQLKGPYSVIFYKETTRTLYFGRDPLGRNSLLLEKENDVLRILSTSASLGNRVNTIELPPLGLYKIDPNAAVADEIQISPWMELNDSHRNEVISSLENVLRMKVRIIPIIGKPIYWRSEIKSRFDFSDIISKASDGIEINFPYLLQQNGVLQTVEEIVQHLKKSIQDRIENTTEFCSSCLRDFLKVVSSESPEEIVACGHSKIGILFSGGIDCTLIAALAHEFVQVNEPIDLINVAFERAKSGKNSTEINWNVPDRETALKSVTELQELFPSRKWNLVEVNVTRDELQKELNSKIKNLIYPLNTVLDESLGCAFWFAANGIGLLNNDSYKSPCRVILVGSGADELFAGYTRHRNAYMRCDGDHIEKVENLRKELDLDWTRIPYRNLGRDDRVIGDCGKTARTPFIEEDLVDYVRNLEPMQKCYFGATAEKKLQIPGDKLLLRLCGYKIGLQSASSYKKTAIQFGSRIANKNQNAKDISVHLLPTTGGSD